jgi:hypothetical protein
VVVELLLVGLLVRQRTAGSPRSQAGASAPAPAGTTPSCSQAGLVDPAAVLSIAVLVMHCHHHVAAGRCLHAGLNVRV